MEPMLSVLMPVYNAEPYVGEAIESVLRQSFADFEMIIVDDHSTDSSARIIRGYADRDPRIVLLSNDSGKGLVSALNFGLSRARGRWVARFDADDVCDPERFHVQIDFLAKNPEVAVVGSDFSTFGRGHPSSVIAHPRNPLEVSYKFTWNTRLGHPTVIFDRRSVATMGGYPDRSAEDFALFSRMSMDFRISNVPQVLLQYRLHDRNKSVLEGQKIRRDLVEVSSRNLSELHSRPIDSSLYVAFHHREVIAIRQMPGLLKLSVSTFFKLAGRLGFRRNLKVLVPAASAMGYDLLRKTMAQARMRFRQLRR